MNSKSLITHRRNLWRLFAAGLFSISALPFVHGQASAPAPAAEAEATANADPAPRTTATTTNNRDNTSDDVTILDTFEVRGTFAGSLAAAAELKQSSPSITEVIAAEDIGKLPDVSIADSLTRLPGVATQRTNGRSQQIVIRGLTGDFSTGMLNGREQVSTSLNRAIEYDQYPADLLGQVVVYKTAEAGLTGQGLAGTVDLQTVKPLSKSERVVAVNAYYDWTQFKQLTPGAKSSGNHATLSYVDQLDDGKVGVAFGFSHISKPFEGQQYQAWGFDSPGGNLLLGGTKSYVRTSNFDRDAVMGVLEFKPNDRVHSTFDIFYSKFEETQLLRGMEIPLAPNWTSGSGNGTVLQPGATINDGLYTHAVISNVQPVVRNDVFLREAKPFSLGWNLQLNENSEWPVTFDVGFSHVKRTDLNLESYSGLGFRAQPGPADTITVDLTPGQIPVFTTTLDYADGTALRLTDPQGWGPNTLPGGGMYGYLKGFQAKDNLTQAKLSTRHALDRGALRNVEFGVSYTGRSKNDGEDPSGWIHSPTAQVTLPLPEQIGTTDLGYLGLGEIYAYDPLRALRDDTWGFTPNPDGGVVANRYKISESVYQLYGQIELDSRMGEVPFTGNLGLRVIHTDQSARGFSANGNNLNAVTAEDKYTQIAPSLNLNFKPAENTFVRVSVARQIARPRMYDMRASRTWGFDVTKASNTDLGQSPWSGGGGNTALRPWDSYSFDVSLEKYFAEGKGYVAVAGYYKDLRNFIYQQNAVADFSQYPVSSGASPNLFEGIISTPVNGSGGSIQGVEGTLSLPSELLNPEVRGLGLVLGLAYTDSSIEPWGPGNGTAPIAGLSEWVGNVTVYYERAGFSIRLSDRYRSENRQYITTFGVPNPGGDVNPNGGFSVAQPENVIDGQIGYTFQGDSQLQGLSIYLQAYNLNNEPLVTFNNGDKRQVINYQKYGASYSAGVSYKF